MAKLNASLEAFMSKFLDNVVPNVRNIKKGLKIENYAPAVLVWRNTIL